MGSPYSHRPYRLAEKVAAALVAAVFLYGAGFMSQRILEAPRPPEIGMEAPSHMLLLWESNEMPAASTAAGTAIAQEYAAWAGGQTEHGRLPGGEELGGEARFVRRDSDTLIQETVLQSRLRGMENIRIGESSIAVVQGQERPARGNPDESVPSEPLPPTGQPLSARVK